MPRSRTVKTKYGQMPRFIYEEVKMLIANYHTMVSQLNTKRQDIIFSGAISDGLPQKNHVGNPTCDKSVELVVIGDRITAIKKVSQKIEAEYSSKKPINKSTPFNAIDAFCNCGTFKQTRYDPVKKKEPHEITWKRFRKDFAYLVAKELKYIV